MQQEGRNTEEVKIGLDCAEPQVEDEYLWETCF